MSAEDARRTLEEKEKEYLERMAQRKMDHERALAVLEEKHKNAIKQCQEEYEGDLKKLTSESYIHEVRRHINSTVPIARLPPEILSEIFLIFAIEYWDVFKRTSKLVRDRIASARQQPWMTLKHVCRRWQDVVLHTPSLFTTIAPRRKNLVDFELKQSRTRLIDLLHYSVYEKEALDLALRQLHRVRSMELVLDSDHFNSIKADGEYALEAPKLISVDYEIPFGGLLQFQHLPVISDLHAPSLTSLKVVGGTLQLFKTFTRPMLTTLDVSFWEHCPVPQFMTTLATMPALCTLSLRLNDSTNRYDGPNLPVHVTLPALTSLTLYEHCFGYSTSRILGYIKSPSLKTLNFWLRLTDWCQPTFAPRITAALGTKMRLPSLSATFRPRTIAVKDSYYKDKSPGKYFVVAVWTSEREMEMPDDMDQWAPEPQGSSCFSQRCADAQSIVEKLLPMFDCANLSRVWFQTDLSVVATRELWECRLRSMPNLTVLCVYGFGVEELLRVRADEHEVPLFPYLKTLIMHDIVVNDETDHSSLSALVSALRSRQTAASSCEVLERLVLYSPKPKRNYRTHEVVVWNVPQGQITFLVEAQVAKLVEADGIEYEYFEPPSIHQDVGDVGPAQD
ncbi:hypothetical protein EIP86_003181 [Pleurotus ostreatoroseus]|nr:hypothetical protein EIP86_003181 [Pleurotus ostreatoroseus]